MKFPRNARMFKGHLDAAPLASVFFCLLIFVLLSSLIYTPGVRIQLPEADPGLPAVSGPTVAVAVDPLGQYYFENRAVRPDELERKLKEKVQHSPEPLTLVVLADKRVPLDKLGAVLRVGRAAGILPENFSWGMLPRVFDAAPETKK
jgi:biopolymer transport protein ExbD